MAVQHALPVIQSFAIIVTLTALSELFPTPADLLTLWLRSRLAILRPNWNWPASDVVAVQIFMPQRESALVALADDLVDDLVNQAATTTRGSLVSVSIKLACNTIDGDQG